MPITGGLVVDTGILALAMTDQQDTDSAIWFRQRMRLYCNV